MATTTTEQIVREAPEVEALRLGLLNSAKGLAEQPLQLPSYNVAGLSPLTSQASQLAAQGVGSYLPYLNAAQGALTGSAATYNDARGILGGGLSALSAFPGAYNYLGSAQQAGAGAQAGAGQAVGTAAQGMGQASQNISNVYGATAPELQRASQASYGAGMGGQLSALDAQQMLSGTGGSYNPQSYVSSFMNPYLEDVVNQQYQDIQRLGDLQRNTSAANAVSRGAFGGSRSAVEQAEIGRNTLEQQARTGSQLRASGYQSAADSAQKAYEAAMARQQQGAQLYGQLGQAGAATGLQAAQQAGSLGYNLGQLGYTGAQAQGQLAQQAGAQGLQYGQLGMSQADLLRQLGTSGGALAGQQAEISRALGLGIGSLGTELGKLGVQQAALGELQSKLGTTDIQNLATMGSAEQQQQQQSLDASRASTLQQLYEPYQRAGFLSDIYKGTPTSQQTLASSTAPNPSLGSQVVGTGIAALGGAAALNKSGLLR